MSDMTIDLRARETDEGYSELERGVKTTLEIKGGPLFTVDTDSLFDTYLCGLPSNKQHYNCRCCRAFVERFGGLVTIDKDTGKTRSAVWPEMVPAFFEESISDMRNMVEKRPITGVFLSSQPIHGVEKSPKGWTHLHARNHEPFKDKLLTADQRAAEFKEEYGLMQRTIQEYPSELIRAAVQILASEQFPGYEKGLGIAKWYLELMERRDLTKNSFQRNNYVWLAVATAPPGFTHLKTGMVGTLLEDLREGKSFEQCRAAWKQKMAPEKYRRPTAELSAGQVKVAEQTVEKLGIANSLKRRFAKQEDVKSVFWTPRLAEEPVVTPGIFASLLTKHDPIPTAIYLPNQNMTWMKFERDIFPSMQTLEVFCPAIGGYTGCCTAVDPDAPPILQWDHEGDRNPVSYYIYTRGSAASQWGIHVGWNPVTCMYRSPHGDMQHFKRWVGFAVKGCQDQYQGGLALFPEILKNELRTIEKVIEKYSNAGKMEGAKEGNMNGLTFGPGSVPVQLKVNGNALYTLVMWE